VPAPFVVLYYGNTGSSWLIETLGHLPDVLVPAFEPLEAHVWRVPDAVKVAWVRNAFSVPATRTGAAFDEWIEGLRASPQFKGLIRSEFSTVAFKMTRSAVRSTQALVDVFGEFGTRLVFLRRENRIKHALSLYRHHEEAKSQFDRSGIRPPSDVDFRRYERWLRQSVELDEIHREFKEECERELGSEVVTEVDYEELITEEDKATTIGALTEFLGFPGVDVSGGSFEKATPDELRSAIVNYDRFRRKFRRGPMKRYFED
jgi:LPS sulfotransferase NodH